MCLMECFYLIGLLLCFLGSIFSLLFLFSIRVKNKDVMLDAERLGKYLFLGYIGIALLIAGFLLQMYSFCMMQF